MTLSEKIEEAVCLADIAVTYDSVGRRYTHVTNAAEVAAAILRFFAEERAKAEGEVPYRGVGCDARNGGPHEIETQGTYKFCRNCGETVKSPALTERLRQAESNLAKAEARIAELTQEVTGVLEPQIEQLADVVVQRVTEYDDRTSPEDWPEALLITGEELYRELMTFAADLLDLIAKLKAAPLQGEGSSSSRVEENSPSGRTSGPSSTGVGE